MYFSIRPLTISDLPAALDLWARTEDVGLNESDTPDRLAVYLNRNPGQSLAAIDSAGTLLGAILSGNDGRRGYLHHLAVDKPFRRHGIGRQLVRRCLLSLGDLGILKCNIFVYASNADGQKFWSAMGWKSRADLRLMQIAIPTAP